MATLCVHDSCARYLRMVLLLASCGAGSTYDARWQIPSTPGGRAPVEILRRVAWVLGRLDVRAVVTTGRAIDPGEVPSPGNVRVVRAAPHRQVLTEASVVITHAGHGSVLKALAAGVPLICMPQGRDQKDNTMRVLRLGAGVRISKRATEQQIAAAVRAVLNNPTYTSAARRFAATLSKAVRYPDAIQETENPHPR